MFALQVLSEAFYVELHLLMIILPTQVVRP